MAAAAFEDALRAAFTQALARDTQRTIIVDLSAASFIDSRMIGVLVKWVEQFEAKGWRMPIVCTDPNMLRVFDLIGLRATFTFVDSRDAAVANA